MLFLKEAAPGNSDHTFTLSNIGTTSGFSEFELSSKTYSGLTLSLTVPYPEHPLPAGYTTSVYLFKNAFHLQSEIIDLRVTGLNSNSGKLGYFFRMDALFEPGILNLNAHTYCYAIYALNYLFSETFSLQTKVPEISSRTYAITDFFDEDTIILVLCDQYCALVPNFSLDNYLANLYLYGFTYYERDNPIETVNLHSYLASKYNDIKSVKRPDGVFILKLSEANSILSGETFVSHLFKALIQKKSDPVARFLMLYQVVEIYMSKIFPQEISKKICSQLATLNSFKLKDILTDMQKQKSLIQSLFNIYARPTSTLETAFKSAILDLFVYVNHIDYQDASKNSAMTLTELFYDIRNRLVHEYRLLHTPGVDRKVSIKKLELINELAEALMAEVVTVFKA